jgi:hypothetical protein
MKSSSLLFVSDEEEKLELLELLELLEAWFALMSLLFVAPAEAAVAAVRFMIFLKISSICSFPREYPADSEKRVLNKLFNIALEDDIIL